MEFLPAFLLALVIGFIVFVPFTTVFRKLTQPSKTWLSCLLDALLELPQLLRLGKFARDNDINEALRTAVVATGLRDLTLPEEDLSFVSRYVETRRVGRERLSVSYSPSGYLMVQEMLHRRMCTRLRFVDYLQHHPEVGRVALKDPIFVIGFPRTGTTFLHELLGLHPGVRMHYTWEQIDPVPHAYLHASKAAEPDTCDPAPSPSSSPLPSGPELAVMQADRRMRFDSFRTRFRVITALLGEQVQVRCLFSSSLPFSYYLRPFATLSLLLLAFPLYLSHSLSHTNPNFTSPPRPTSQSTESATPSRRNAQPPAAWSSPGPYPNSCTT